MLKKFLDFILFGSLFIGFCTVAMCVETNLLLGVPFNPASFYLFVFAATVFQYNLHYLLKRSAVKGSDRLAWSQKNNRIHWILIVISMCLIFTSLFSFKLHHFIFLSVMGVITFLYSIPVLPFRQKKRIKDFGILKILTITLLWTLVTVWFPIDQAIHGDLSFQFVFARRFIFIFVLCLMFDLRDAEIDRKENIHTIPVITGVQRAYQIAYLLLGIFILLSVVQFFRVQHLGHLNAMILSALATLVMIEYTKKNKADFVYLACIDGMMLLQALLVIFGSV
ncbi:MAG: UbiA family prenyltransferase [Ginsengibacter sp.]